MKSIKLLISCLLIFVISGYNYSQEDIPSNWSYISISSLIDVQFINQTTGFIAVRNGTDIDVKKTTNYGANWTSLIPSSTVYCGYDIKPASIYFFNENTGLVSSDNGIFKYNNGNFQRVHTYTDFYGNSKANIIHKIVFVNSNTGYAIHTFKNTYGADEYTRGNVYKTTNGGDNWSNLYINMGENGSYIYSYFVNDIAFSSTENNKVIVCGYIKPKYTYNSQNTFFVKTDDGFANKVVNSNGLGSFSAVYVKSNNNVIFLRRGDHEDNPQYSNILSIAWNNLGNTPTSLFQFQSPSNSAYNHTAMNFYDDNTGSMIVDVQGSTKRLYKTTNGGTNWSTEFDNISASNNEDYFGSISDKFYENNWESFYFINSYPYNDKLYIRKIENVSLFAKNEIENISCNNITIDGGTYSSPTTNNWLRPFSNVTFPLSSGSENIFYRWPDNYANRSRTVFFSSSNKIIEAYYKGKFKSDNPLAISSGSFTKSFRDTNGTINQVHESQGGVFYSSSTDNGANFSNEEIINHLDAINGNKNAFISEIKQGNSTFTPYSEGNIITIYQRREGNTEMFKCLYKNIVPPNYKVWEELSYLNFSFTSQNPFDAKARIFAQQGTSNNPNNQYDLFTLTTYLYPNGSNVELKVKVGGGYPYQQDFTIDEWGVVSDYSVTRSTQGNYQVLYFTYIKDNAVYYKCFKFYIAYQQAYCIEDSNHPNSEDPISEIDGQTTRISPDISLKNGNPIIAYRGSHTRNWNISYEGNNNGDNWITVNLYPVIICYRNNNDIWTSFKYESDGQHTNEFPNVEGSKDANAFLINYKSAPSLFKQFVKLDAGGNYRCEPPTYSGTDAKLVRGCYAGQTGNSSYPMLMTLHQNASNNQAYDIGKRNISITDQGSVFDYGFDNMNGVIEKNESDYVFNLGPIFVRNSVCGFNEEVPPVSIESAVDFNNNMVSNKFSLTDNDTLIIGAFGSHITNSFENFQPMKFHVDLISSSSGEHLRELFRDTIKIEDSVETEYLRGFIITGIPNGTDSFYVQLFVDTLDGDGGYGYGVNGVYVPGDQENGDNPMKYKKLIHFGKNNPVKTINIIPKEYSLSQNYPNPFNPVTNIKYQLPKDGFVTLKIYDITGREIAKLVNEQKPAGNYTVLFNGSNFASGVYFYRIQSGDFVQVKKMVLIK
jgi:photosystem II stability/assembly factor-like uncharacterized protein